MHDNGKLEEMAVSKKRKKILFIILIILMALFLGVYMVRKLPKQIQGMIKNKVSSYVVKNQAELYETVVEMNNLERGYVEFFVFEYWIHSSRFYRCGFYYSEEDVPVDVFSGDYVDSDTTVYETWPIFMHYWYRTDKIMDNWWYYEEWWVIVPDPHRSIKEEIIGFIEYYLIDEVFPPEF